MKLYQKAAFFLLAILMGCTTLAAQDTSTVVYPFGLSVNLDYLSSGEPGSLGAIDYLKYDRPLVSMDFGLVATNGWAIEVGVSGKKELQLDGLTNLPVGGEGNPVPFENNFLTKGILSWSGPIGRAVLGRQAYSQGPSSLSNLQLTRQLPYLDSLILEIPLGPSWSLSQVVGSLENRPTVGDIALQSSFTQQGIYDFEKTAIWFSSRRFAYSNSWMEAGIGSLSIFSRPLNTFQLGDIFPVFSMHNGNPGWHNQSIYLDFLHKGLNNQRQYAILGLDDFNANLFGINDGGIPTIWAFILGADGRFELGNVLLDYTLELVNTHYLWGNFHDDYALSRAIYRIYSDAPFNVPLTSPYGPGRLSLNTDLVFSVASAYKLDWSALLLMGDPTCNLVNNRYEPAESSLQFLVFRTDLDLKWQIFETLQLYAGAGLDYTLEDTEYRIRAGLVWSYVNNAMKTINAAGENAFLSK